MNRRPRGEILQLQNDDGPSLGQKLEPHATTGDFRTCGDTGTGPQALEKCTAPKTVPIPAVGESHRCRGFHGKGWQSELLDINVDRSGQPGVDAMEMDLAERFFRARLAVRSGLCAVFAIWMLN